MIFIELTYLNSPSLFHCLLGCLWHLVFVYNSILILGIWCSTIPHLPGCFCPWTFFENIGVNTAVFDFSAGPSARGRQLYCRACNFKNVSALLAGNFYTCSTESYGLLMYTGSTRFYSNDIHLVKIKSNIKLRCVPWYLEMAKLYQLVPYKKCKFFIIILMVESNTDDIFFLLINVINGSWYQVKVNSH